MTFFLYIEFLTQRDPTTLEECSPTEPASSLQSSQSCTFSWTYIVATDSISYQ
jgi:hypothetical protein